MSRNCALLIADWVQAAVRRLQLSVARKPSFRQPLRSSRLKAADIIIREGKAYIPTFAHIKHGRYYLIVEPVYIVNPTIDEVTRVLEHLVLEKHRVIAEPTLEELKAQKDPMLEATGTRSWKAMARNSLAYGIELTDQAITVALPKLDKQGRFAPDAPRVQLPANTTMRELATFIINDAETRLKQT